MKHLLLTYALTQTKGKVNPATVYGWVEKFGTGNDYCSLRSGRADYVTQDTPTFIAFKEYLTERIETYKPKVTKKTLPEEKSSAVASSSQEMDKLESAIKALRNMGYIINCSIQTPARKL